MQSCNETFKPYSSKKFCALVCGIGSVGERHLRNLKRVGIEDIILYRVRNRPLRTVDEEYPTYCSLNEALEKDPDFAIISNPTHLHVPTALKCAKGGCHLLIEKPISHNDKNIDKLREIVDDNNLIALVGYMLRFHPCLIQAKEWVEEGEVGRLVFARSTWGEYLPDWHPWEDYRDSYAAKRSMGGGPALTLSHDLDIMRWFLGEFEDVVAMDNTASELEVETEHGIDILNRHPGKTSNVHLDYFQKPPMRKYEFVGTKGRIKIDYFDKRVTLYRHEAEDISDKKNFSGEFERNDMFIDEICHFLNCIIEGQSTDVGLDEGVDVLQHARDAIQATGVKP